MSKYWATLTQNSLNLNALIKIKGVVTKRTAVFPELREKYFRCGSCGDLKGPLYHNNSEDPLKTLGMCAGC